MSWREKTNTMLWELFLSSVALPGRVSVQHAACRHSAQAAYHGRDLPFQSDLGRQEASGKTLTQPGYLTQGQWPFLAELPASTTKFFLSVSLLLLKTRPLYVDQANLELEAIIPPQPSRCWNYTREPPQPDLLLSFIFSFSPPSLPFFLLTRGLIM